jgi:hypothetical protein
VRVLSAFETALRGGEGALQAALEASQRDTALLKRAVAIQNARQHEAAAAAASEVAELRSQLVEQQAQLNASQLNAYSLSMHLREAMSPQQQLGGRWVT